MNNTFLLLLQFNTETYWHATHVSQREQSLVAVFIPVGIELGSLQEQTNAVECFDFEQTLPCFLNVNNTLLLLLQFNSKAYWHATHVSADH